MSITGVKSYSTANIQGQNSSNDTATINARLTIDELAIVGLQQTTTGMTYNTTGDLTTIDNNLTVGANNLKCSYVCTSNDDVVNKLYCDTKIANLVASAPTTLDTLNELATALGNDPNYATSTATLIGGKASLSTNQTISGINTLSNTSNVYYGDGSHLTGVSSTLPANALTTNTAQTIISTGSKTFENSSIIMSDAGSGGAGILTTTLKQSFLSNMFEFTQNVNNGGFIFYKSTGANTIIDGGNVSLTSVGVSATTDPTKLTQHTQTSNAYLIDNNVASGTITLKVKDSTGGYANPTAFILDSNALTLGSKIKMYNGLCTSTIDGCINNTRNLNIQTSSIYNSNVILTGFIPTGILNVMILTTSNWVGLQNVQITGAQILGQSANNLYILSTAMKYTGLSVSNTVNTTTITINGAIAWPIGTHFTTTANYIGHWITAILGGGQYTVTPPLAGLNALHLEDIQWIPLNRSYANATTSASIYFDTTIGIDFKHENTVLGTTWKSMVLDENRITVWKPIVQNDYMYGRIDGAPFNVAGLNGNYPIGYTVSFVPNTITFTTGVAQTFISPALAKGVWIISGWGELTRGTGTYVVGSYIRVIIDKTTAGQGNVSPTAFGSATRISIASTSTDITIQAPISCVCISLNDLCTTTISIVVVMTVGTATVCPRMSFTKIA